MLHRVAGGGGPGGNLDFTVDRGQVIIDRVRSDDQLLGDVRIRESLRNKTQHFDLASGQPIGIGRCWLPRRDR